MLGIVNSSFFLATARSEEGTGLMIGTPLRKAQPLRSRAQPSLNSLGASVKAETGLGSTPRASTAKVG